MQFPVKKKVPPKRNFYKLYTIVSLRQGTLRPRLPKSAGISGFPISQVLVLYGTGI